MSLARYALMVVATLGGSLALAWPILAASGPRAPWAALAGGGLAAANTVTAYSLVVWAQRRSTVVFFRAVLGGMVGRMALMLGAVVAGIVLLGLPRLPLTFSLLGYFVLFLVFELAVVQKRTTAAVAER